MTAFGAFVLQDSDWTRFHSPCREAFTLLRSEVELTAHLYRFDVLQAALLALL